MVSLHMGLIFSTFVKLVNKYRLATDNPEYIKINKLCIALTDADGNIHGMNNNCTEMIGMPSPAAIKHVNINDN